MSVDKRNFVNRHFPRRGAPPRGDAKEVRGGDRSGGRDPQRPPSPQHLVEELKIQEDARSNLAAWKKAA
jgi:hypothetical protein